jgi:hypothetical protein
MPTIFPETYLAVERDSAGFFVVYGAMIAAVSSSLDLGENGGECEII